MSEKLDRPRRRNLLSVTVDEVDSGNGMDHVVAISARYGGMNLAVEATMDQIRDFFTKKREKRSDLRAI